MCLYQAQHYRRGPKPIPGMPIFETLLISDFFRGVGDGEVRAVVAGGGV